MAILVHSTHISLWSAFPLILKWKPPIMRFSAGALSILSALYTQSVIAPWCGFTGTYGQPSEPLCHSVRDLDFPPRDDEWRIFAPEANWGTDNHFAFPKVLTPVQHQRVVRCTVGIAVRYTSRATTNGFPMTSFRRMCHCCIQLALRARRF